MATLTVPVTAATGGDGASALAVDRLASQLDAVLSGSDLWDDLYRLPAASSTVPIRRAMPPASPPSASAGALPASSDAPDGLALGPVVTLSRGGRADSGPAPEDTSAAPAVTSGSGADDGGSGTVTMMSTTTNNPPVAVGDSFDILHDFPLDGNVMDDNGDGADYDLDSMDMLTVSLDSGPSHGSLDSFSSDGFFSYMPDPLYVGSDSFTYTLSDGTDTATGTVTIDVTNTAPVAEDDTFYVPHDFPLDGNVMDDNGMGYDYDLEGDFITASLDSGPTHGTLNSFGSDGTFSYQPDPLYVGPDSFTYTVTDNIATDSATVTINVTNTAPVAVNDSYSVVHNQTLTEFAPGVLANDHDAEADFPLTASLASGPSNGTLTYFNSDGSFEYVPDTDYVGPDSFTYTVSDGIATGSPPATVLIDVYNTPPDAQPDEYAILQNVLLEVPVSEGVLQNDSDMEGDAPLTAVLVTQAANGTVALSADGSFTYDPQPTFVGEDTFEYKVSDGYDDSLAITVTILVTPPRILIDSAAVDASNVMLMVGQHVPLSVELPNLPFGTFPTYAWSIAGDTVKQYLQSEPAAAVTELQAADLANDAVSFYWIDGEREGEEKQVSVTVTVNGRQVTASETFSVIRPTAALTATTTSDNPAIAVGNPGFPQRDRIELHFGSINSLGIIWDASVNTPAGGAGALAFTQLIDSLIDFTKDDGTDWRLDSNGYVVDSGAGVQYGGATPIGEAATQAFSRNDSPGEPLDGKTHVERTDAFKLYLMYKPAGDSIWVTLRQLTWGWTGETTKDPNTGEWSAPVPDSYYASASVDTTELPVWDDYIEGIDEIQQP